MNGAFIERKTTGKSSHQLKRSPFGYHLSRFILEVRKKDGTEFHPESLHHIICGIQHHLRFHGKPEIDFFKDAPFVEFRMGLDAEMEHLLRCGVASKKSLKKRKFCDTNVFWIKLLVDSMLYMCRLYFTLKSREEHRQTMLSSIPDSTY